MPPRKNHMEHGEKIDAGGEKAKQKHERAAQIRSKRAQLADTKKNARDAVCTGPKYPGSPQDYTYVLQEYCRPHNRRSARIHAPSTPPRPRQGRDATLVISSTDREIRSIKKALQAYGPEHATYVDRFPANAVLHIDTVFAAMIDPDHRAAVPDPLARYDQVVREDLRDDDSVAVEEMPRYMILSMVLYHLLAVKKLYSS